MRKEKNARIAKSSRRNVLSNINAFVCGVNLWQGKFIKCSFGLRGAIGKHRKFFALASFVYSSSDAFTKIAANTQGCARAPA